MKDEMRTRSGPAFLITVLDKIIKLNASEFYHLNFENSVAQFSDFKVGFSKNQTLFSFF